MSQSAAFHRTAKAVKCGVCEEVLTDKRQALKHLVAAYPETAKDCTWLHFFLYCDVCRYFVIQKSNLEQHMAKKHQYLMSPDRFEVLNSRFLLTPAGIPIWKGAPIRELVTLYGGCLPHDLPLPCSSRPRVVPPPVQSSLQLSSSHLSTQHIVDSRWASSSRRQIFEDDLYTTTDGGPMYQIRHRGLEPEEQLQIPLHPYRHTDPSQPYALNVGWQDDLGRAITQLPQSLVRFHDPMPSWVDGLGMSSNSRYPVYPPVNVRRSESMAVQGGQDQGSGNAPHYPHVTPDYYDVQSQSSHHAGVHSVVNTVPASTHLTDEDDNTPLFGNTCGLRWKRG